MQRLWSPKDLVQTPTLLSDLSYVSLLFLSRVSSFVKEQQDPPMLRRTLASEPGIFSSAHL